MPQILFRHLSLFVVTTVFASVAQIGLASPEIGWQADLETLFHDVSGTVLIVDDDTIRVDDFVYDGGGPSVFFYLGTENTDSAFESGLRIGEQLNGNAFDGTQPPLTVDLPAGETIEGYHAISVWCSQFGANFGSGTFFPPPVPEPASIALIGVGIIGVFTPRRRRSTG